MKTGIRRIPAVAANVLLAMLVASWGGADKARGDATTSYYSGYVNHTTIGHLTWRMAAPADWSPDLDESLKVSAPPYAVLTDIDYSIEDAELGRAEMTHLQIPTILPWESHGEMMDSSTSVTAIRDGSFAGRFEIQTVEFVWRGGGKSMTNIGSAVFSNCTSLTTVSFEEQPYTTPLMPPEFHLRTPSRIGKQCFYGCTSLTNIDLPDTVTDLGEEALAQCTSLKTATVGQKTTRIPQGLFKGCSALESVTFRGDITEIGDYAFYGCSALTNLVIPDSVTNIGYNAFYGCTGLVSVEIGDGVTGWPFDFSGCTNLVSVTVGKGIAYIDNHYFEGCDRLEQVNVQTGNPAYTSLDGVVFTKDMATLVFCPPGKRGAYEVPAGVESIGFAAFENCTSLESVTLPASVADIANSAFDGCTRLSSYVVAGGNAVYSSADGVLFDAAGATLLAYPAGRAGTVYTIPAGVEAIRPTAFRDCTTLATLEVAMGNMAYSSVGGALYSMDGTELRVWPRGKGGRNVVIPPGTLQIGDSVFENREDLVSVAFPEGLQRIGRNAFRGCSGLTAVELPEGLKRIESVAFCMTGLETVTVPKSVRWIGGAAFASTPLQSATILGGAISGEDGAFFGCRSLTTLTLGTRVSAISHYAFANYSSRVVALETVHAPVSWEGKTCPLSGGFFGADFTIVYDNEVDDGEPTEEEEEYEDAWRFQVVDGGTVLGVWSEVGGKVVIPSTLGGCPVTAIADYAFYYGGDVLTSLGIPGTVTNVGSMAFAKCNALTALYVPESWEGTDMLDNAWGGAGQPAGCEIVYYDVDPEWSYTVADGKATVTGVVPAKGELVVPATLGGYPVAAIGDNAFMGCIGLTSVVVPGGVTDIGSSAFSGCTGLVSVVIPEGVSRIRYGTFTSCRVLTNLVLPESLLAIDSYAFSGCSGLTELKLPGCVECIYESAFQGCTGLAILELPESLSYMDRWAFYGCTGLTCITMPSGRGAGFEYNTFGGCTALERFEVAEGNQRYSSRDGVLYSADGKRLVLYPAGRKAESYAVPEGVTEIAWSAFGGCGGLTGLVLPDSLENLDGSGAFEGCGNLAGLEAPASWKEKHFDNYGESVFWTVYAGVPEGCMVTYRDAPAANETQTTPVPVAHSWLEERAADILAANGGDHEAAANAKAANGRPVWECYVADVSVADAAGDFKTVLVQENGQWVAKPSPDRGDARNYTVQGASGLGGEEAWGPVTDDSRFFRVKVALPE